MPAELTDGQYELDGLTLGAGTAYVVREFETGKPTTRNVDTPNPYGPGVAFGRDLLDGVIANLDILVETAAGGPSFDAVETLETVWRGDGHRDRPADLVTLRCKRPGAPARKLYGRPRAFTPVRSKGTGVGLVPVVADFQGVDDRWYADEAHAEVLPIVPASTGGIITEPGGGIVSPISTAAATGRPGIIHHDGTVDTWPVVTFRGPVLNPSVELVRGGAVVWRLEFAYSLGEGRTVTIDTRPWVASVLDDQGVNLGGKRTRRSTPLMYVTVPPGQSALVFRGTSTTGTATCTVAWEAAYPAH